MTQQAIYDRITAVTRNAFGQSINPHLFRHIAATTQAIVDPSHVGISPLLLGHRDSQTTAKYYTLAHSLEATRRYQQEVIRRRRGS